MKIIKKSNVLKKILMNDNLTFNDENFVRQLTDSVYESGFYRVRFYSLAGRPSAAVTDTVESYYYYPSGGTLRDKNFNIIEYFPRFDTYRGFKPPHLKEENAG